VQVEHGRLSSRDVSRGQRKRLALLTVLLEDRPVYVLDEWAADQDSEFKEIFYRQLLPELKRRGKTLVIISHDERYYGLADRRIHLADGRVAETSATGHS
jgi:putative ATP-binding cassette transporter